ncbi:MAG: diadenylate cyclase CdaA [Bacillota bacterium]|uniref:diadenylate cyclase CdaA n=1 Tax=Desulfurispora thermophila TaxID=265470 RepID=UPI00036C29ED|nr:diadenylate cyclase CdaA [Desulfurispora thermophila]
MFGNWPGWNWHFDWNIDFNFWDIFGLTSIIDIAIVTYVLYRLMLLIKGTRAVQLLKGIAVLLVATAISSLFKLYTLHWLLKQSLYFLAVALPIVFQPELRRALEKIGGGKFIARSFVNLSEGELEKTISSIGQAVEYLAERRIGALLVLERVTGLEEHAETGVKLDAWLSAELLVNLFIPKTPLHDGAVIVRGSRILAAGCVLPLTDEHNLSKELGTRHRAGIGISEVSDALAVMVSEETGKISLAVEGTLLRGLTRPALEEKLQQLWQVSRQASALGQLWMRR